MAEFVQQSVEEMLPELEQMERVGLFTGSETRTILRKRRNYEYKLRRRTKQKEDYLNYIQYEISMLSLVKKRRERLGYSFKREDIDVAIVQRVHKLFKLALFRFQDDVKLWLSHIEFCKMRRETATISRMYTRMLQVHNRKPKLWIMAAKWEMEENKAIENARNLLQRALRFNPKSKQLWTEYFRMELLNAEKMRKRKEILGLADMDDDEAISDAVMNGQIAEVVYRQATESFPDEAGLCLSLLEIARLFDFTQDFQTKIVTDLQERHSDNEETWDGIARHQLIDADVDVDERMCACCQIYDRAVQKMTTECMWTYYLKFCLEQCQLKAKKRQKAKRVELTLSVFERGQQAGCISEVLYLEWMKLLIKAGQLDRLKEVVTAATKAYPDSCTLWKERLAWCFKSESNDEIHSSIQEALTHLSDKAAWPVWQMSIDWCLQNNAEKMEELLEKGLLRGSEICAPIKCCYLDWVAESGDIRKIRQLYKRLSVSQPLSVDFFTKYITLELNQPEVKMKRVRQAYEDAIMEYGSKDPDLWLSYIKLELSPVKGQPENAGTLHWRAVKMLDDSLTQDFLDAYTLLQTGHHESQEA